MPLSEFAASLEDVLRSLCERPGRWILIAEDDHQPLHYWQALCFEDGSLCTEVVSNHYLEGDDRLSVGQEELLRLNGWGVPDPPLHTNWYRIESTTSPNLEDVATQSARALREVFRLSNLDEVRTRLFASPLRGATPASPDYHKILSTEARDHVAEGTVESGDDLAIRIYSRPDPEWSDEERGTWAQWMVNQLVGQAETDSPPQ
jgi:hypothetical protein